MTVRVYVEGGGDHNKALSVRCRQGFSEFLQKAGLRGRMPRVVACGARDQAYKSFLISHEKAGGDEVALLLVDSEGPVSALNPWDHVRQRDDWARPHGTAEDQLHLMVQVMEAWFLADKDALQAYFGRAFRPDALSPRPDVENILKADVFAGMGKATKDCTKGAYSKGDHSFQILGRIDPAKVRTASPQAERFLKVLDGLC